MSKPAVETDIKNLHLVKTMAGAALFALQFHYNKRKFFVCITGKIKAKQT